MLLRLNIADNRPLHEQVAGVIRRAIAEGECGPGDRLPPARELSQALGVNANTVLRGLRALRDEGLLEFRRGRGVTVAGGADGRSALLVRVRELVADGARLGYGKADLIEMIEEAQ
ncbi:GntR family transcriptional regulator [Streptomyces sp. NPDC090741]|uniref:GntR family transcriptional regulator n=1 Tax=Streptomyces sp. NPDC090741 TaxID=3365967 RepID=UPI00382359BD